MHAMPWPQPRPLPSCQLKRKSFRLREDEHGRERLLLECLRSVDRQIRSPERDVNYPAAAVDAGLCRPINRWVHKRIPRLDAPEPSGRRNGQDHFPPKRHGPWGRDSRVENRYTDSGRCNPPQPIPDTFCFFLKWSRLCCDFFYRFNRRVYHSGYLTIQFAYPVLVDIQPPASIWS